MIDPVERAKALYVNQRTGEWYTIDSEEAEIARDLVAEVERLRSVVLMVAAEQNPANTLLRRAAENQQARLDADHA
jgi:hypothetical protein